MVFKLAWRNVRRSVRDYAIYFATLVFGVAVFYAFNSIESQQLLFDIQSAADAKQFQTTAGILGMFSGVIACVLGFLVLYANRFLVRRRKREFGIYLLLGMRPSMVSGIVLVETVMVGLIALVVGLLLGIVVSQGLSFLTASLFGVIMNNYQFVFSQSAFLFTIGCFALIFAVVTVFNAFSVSRFRLVNLLQADLRNEKAKVRNPWVCAIVFVVSIVILVFAYVRLKENGLLMLDDPAFVQATAGMLLGSLLFFWSLAGMVIGVVSRRPGLYLKRLRPFTLRQVASRINTAFVSLWAVCVLLFFSITCFSCGMALADLFRVSVEGASPFDMTLNAQVWVSPTGSRSDAASDPAQRRVEMEADAPERLAQAEAADWDMASVLQAADPQAWTDTVAAWGQVNLYSAPGLTFRELADVLRGSGRLSEEEMTYIDGVSGNNNMQMVGVSQLNSVRALQGQEPLQLGESQWALLNNFTATERYADAMIAEAPQLAVAGIPLESSGILADTQLEDSSMTSSGMMLVVPDAVVTAAAEQGFIPEVCYLDLNFAENGRTAEENINAVMDVVALVQPASEGGFDNGPGSYGAGEWAGRLWPVTSCTTQESMFAQSRGLRLMITYLALYIGFVFMVSTAAILAIQQLSSVADSTGRYRTLDRLGCDRRRIYGSLLAQICIYFLVPLGLALCHSPYSIWVMHDTLFQLAATPMEGPIASAAIFLLVIYGGYLAITYFTSRSMVKGALQTG